MINLNHVFLKLSYVVFSFQIMPLSGPVEGGTVVTVSGSNLGQRAEDIQHSVTVAGVPCTVIPDRYEVSSRYTKPHYCIIQFYQSSIGMNTALIITQGLRFITFTNDIVLLASGNSVTCCGEAY